MNNITLVTAFVDINRDTWGNFARGTNEYISAFTEYLKYDFNMVIFIDDRYYSELNDLIVESKSINKLLIPINNLWLNDNIWAFSKLEKEKDIMNNPDYRKIVQHRIDRNYPENCNPYYTILTHSKIDFVNYVIDNNLVDSDYYAWTDFGYFYHKTTEEFLPKGKFNLDKLNLDKVNICLVNPISEQDANILFTLQYAPEKIGAYFFLANANNMKVFQNKCHDMLDRFQTSNIADDEQCLWLYIYFENPELFECHVFGKWHRALNYFTGN